MISMVTRIVLFLKLIDGYTIVTSVNYPNNSKLVKQEILFDKDVNLKKVTVLDSDGNAQITMKFTKIDLSSKFNDDYFDLKNIIEVKEKKVLIQMIILMLIQIIVILILILILIPILIPIPIAVMGTQMIMLVMKLKRKKLVR